MPPFPILMVGNFLSATGHGTRGVCEELATRFAARGWTVYCTSRREARFARLADMLLTAWKQRHLYRVAQVDVYSGPAFLWAEAVTVLLKRLRRPIILTLHGGDLPRFAARYPRRVARLLRRASAVTVPSPYLAEEIKASLIAAHPAFAAEQFPAVHLIPNAIDLTAYPFRERTQLLPRLLWLRAFHSIYNPCLAVRVVALLRQEFPNVHLTMIGPDKRDGSLAETQELIRGLGLGQHVSIEAPAPKREVGSRLAAGDVFLNTSNIDNAPVTVVEALACGLCVASTRVGGVPYLVEDEREALLVPPDDPTAMAGAVRRILRDPVLASRLGRAGRALATERDWSRVLPQWEQLLTECVVSNAQNYSECTYSHLGRDRSRPSPNPSGEGPTAPIS